MCMDVQIPDRDQFIVFSMDGQIPAIPVFDVDTAAPTEPTDPARLPIDLYLVVQVAIPDMAGVHGGNASVSAAAGNMWYQL